LYRGRHAPRLAGCRPRRLPVCHPPARPAARARRV